MLAAIDYNFRPFGNAYYSVPQCPQGRGSFNKQDGTFCWAKLCGVSDPPAGCFDGKSNPVLCQHGQQECQADRVEGCAFASAPSQAAASAFLYCFEYENQADLGSASGCAARFGIDYSKVQACAGGAMGDKVEAANAKATAMLGTSKLGTPWVTLNGKYVQDPSNLLQAVCQALQSAGGDVPPGCNGVLA